MSERAAKQRLWPRRWSTRQGHVNKAQRFERWATAVDVDAFSISPGDLYSFLPELQSDSGPTVLGGIRQALQQLGILLGIDTWVEAARDPEVCNL